MSENITYVTSVYLGKGDGAGEATKALYARLETFGAAGVIGINLFRACKASERAKNYRGGGYRGMAYEKKQWSLNNLCKALVEHGQSLDIVWGWGADAAQEYHRWVLYVDLPTGQASFHTAARGEGPDHPKGWCGRHGSAGWIIAWVARLLDQAQESPHGNEGRDTGATRTW